MEFVKQEFGTFLTQNVPNASLSSIDDVVLGYIGEVLSDVHSDDTSFDVDQFCEMISAYVPEFVEVDSTLVCEWLFELASSMKKHKEGSTLSKSDSKAFENDVENDNHDQCEVPEGAEEVEGKSTHHSAAELTSRLNCNSAQNTTHRNKTYSSESGQSRQMDTKLTVDEEQLCLLVEMFPESSENYIKQTLCRHCGDMDATIQALLECNNEQFREESVKDDKQSGKSSTKFNDNKFKATEKTTKALSTVGTDAHLKNYVLSRYEFVDTHEDKRKHRPLLPKQEPEKKIRYRDNHVVSTKGERFTVLTKKDQEGEEMKKTYVSIKPLRKYRFH